MASTEVVTPRLLPHLINPLLDMLHTHILGRSRNFILIPTLHYFIPSLGQKVPSLILAIF